MIVQVRDQNAVPLENTYACVEMPNSVGSSFKVCTWTRADGRTTFDFVPAGRRKVDVTPPAGFSPGVGGLVQEVDVVKGRESLVDFRLTRN